MSQLPRRRVFRIAVRKFPPFENAIRAQWQAFERVTATGLTLDLVPLDLHALEDALFHTGGMAQGEFDVAFVNTDQVAAMHALGCAVDLAPLIDRDPPEGYPDAWTPSLLRLQRVGSAILGVPFHDGPECLLYRRDLFADPGHQRRFEQQFQRPLTPPRTWEHFHQLARFFTLPEQGLYGTVLAAYPDGHNTVYDFLLQLWTRNGSLFNAHGHTTLHTSEAIEALTFYRELITDPNAVPPNCLTLDSVASGALFAAGHIAFMVNWFGFATHAHTAADSTVRGLLDVASIPTANNGSSVSLNVYWLLTLAAGSPHRDLAWQFLRHSQTPAMDLLAACSGAIGCRRSTWADPGLNTQIPFYHHLEALHARAREIPQRIDWPQIASIIDGVVTAAATTATPIPQLLAEAQRNLNSR